MRWSGLEKTKYVLLVVVTDVIYFLTNNIIYFDDFRDFALG